MLTSDGIINHTGLDFRPQLIKIICNDSRNGINLDGCFISIGAADDHGNQFCNAITHQNSVSASAYKAQQITSMVYCAIFTDNTYDNFNGMRIQLLSMLSNGFSIDFVNADPISRKIYIECIGNAGDIFVGNFVDSYNALGVQTIITGHKTEGLEIYGIGTDILDSDKDRVCLSCGVSDGAVENCVSVFMDNTNTTNTFRFRSEEYIYNHISFETIEQVVVRAKVESFNVDGFSLDYDIINPLIPGRISYISYNGVESRVKSFEQLIPPPPFPQNQIITGIAFVPEVFTVFSNLNALGEGFGTQANFCYGMAMSTDVADQYSFSIYSSDNRTTTANYMQQWENKFIRNDVLSGAYSFVENTLINYSQNSFTLRYTEGDSAERRYTVLSLRKREAIGYIDLKSPSVSMLDVGEKTLFGEIATFIVDLVFNIKGEQSKFGEINTKFDELIFDADGNKSVTGEIKSTLENIILELLGNVFETKSGKLSIKIFTTTEIKTFLEKSGDLDIKLDPIDIEIITNLKKNGILDVNLDNIDIKMFEIRHDNRIYKILVHMKTGRIIVMED